MNIENLTLSVFDRSPVRKDGSGEDAIKETLKLAVLAENLGYSKFWVGEHPSVNPYAGNSPTVLMAAIAAQTDSIIVGSAPILLRTRSALSVAQEFKTLESIARGRIALGLGRGGNAGYEEHAAAALAFPGEKMSMDDANAYHQKIEDILGYLFGKKEGHSFPHLHALAGTNQLSEVDVWMTGSSPGSMVYAANMGLPYSFAAFFGIEGSDAIQRFYRANFTTTDLGSKPRVNVTIKVLCAETEEEAKRLATSSDLVRATQNRSIDTDERIEYYPPEEAANDPRLPEQTSVIVGTPEQVRNGIRDIARKYQTKDITLVTEAYSFDARKKSYELVAQAFNLKPSK